MMTIVKQYPTRAMNTDQKLLAAFVGVFTPQFDGWHAKNNKIPCRGKGHLSGYLTNGKRSSCIHDSSHQVKRTLTDPQGYPGRPIGIAQT